MGAQRVTIVTDSIACLPTEIREQYRIKVLAIHFLHGGKFYTDGVDITPSEAYQLVMKDPDSFKTSAISPGECLEVYRQASKQAKDILCITLSSQLSAVYNVAQGAREQAKIELPQTTTIEVLDSRTVAGAEGLVVLTAARAAAAGKSLSEVIKAAQKVIDSVSLVAILDTIRYVYRTGRIPKVAARVGSMLNIRPLFTVTDGVPHFAGAVRNKERGLERLLAMMRNKVGAKKIHAAVMHAYAPAEAEKLKERVSAEFDCVEIWVCEFSPIMGYSAGAGTLGVAFYPE